jgi:hypothetical protein
LELFHGRATVDEQLDNWGEPGPVFVITWLQLTYLCALRLGLPRPATEGSLAIVQDLIYYDGCYYGDLAVHQEAELRTCEGLRARLEDFDPDKAALSLPTPERRTLR